MGARWLWNEITEFLGVSESLPNYTVISGRAVIIEGHKSVSKMNPCEISFLFGGKTLTVSGEDLCIKKLSKGFAVVAGKIGQCTMSD